MPDEQQYVMLNASWLIGCNVTKNDHEVAPGTLKVTISLYI